jgi:zinc/manganese transport system substrate-binding protein
MKKYLLIAIAVILTVGLVTACQDSTTPSANEKKSIVVTYSILGSIVKDLAGDLVNVTVSIPNGLDPHEWDPSARDIEAINKADLVVQNGLGLEAGMEKALATAKARGVRFFTASDHIDVRHVGPGEGIPSGDLDQVVGAADPHLWTDPVAMKNIVSTLVPELLNDFNIDVADRAAGLETRLDNLNETVESIVAAIPAVERKLVTGHESMGYFAGRYGFKIIGVVIPGLSSQAEVTAGNLSDLKKAIEENNVKAIFTEIGTSPAVAKAISDETGVRVVELTAHALPSDGSYFTFMTDIANVITNALR